MVAKVSLSGMALPGLVTLRIGVKSAYHSLRFKVPKVLMVSCGLSLREKEQALEMEVVHSRFHADVKGRTVLCEVRANHAG